jgi:chitin disaccharide deacetylase
LIELIVNADDLGRTEEINSGIVAAFLHGIVTSASLMVTFPAFDMAVDNVNKHHLPVGIHLNLTEGRPLSDAGAVPSLVDQQGCFFKKNQFFRRLLQWRISLNDVRRELEAQMQRLYDHGLHLDHLDGHHHIHAAPRLAPLCCDLARSAGIRFMRAISPPRYFSPTAAAAEHWSAFFMSSKKSCPNIRRADHFWGYELMATADKEAALLQIFSRLRPGINELMCHPGEVCAEDIGDYNSARHDEVAALCSPAVKTQIADGGIVLTNFRDVE